MDSQAVRTSTIVAISVGTILTGLVGYAVYFDHKRRSDPEFRRSLKRESKRQAKAQKAEQEASAANARKEIAALVREMNEEGYPSDTEQKEKFFLANMAQGEELISSKFGSYQNTQLSVLIAAP
jgi:import receptor subunit TOM20